MRIPWVVVAVGLCGCLQPVEETVLCAGSGACTRGNDPLQAQAEADLLVRWNAAVDALGPSLVRDFHWRVVNDFPHPTYRFGDTVAYTECAQVLARFYATGDNLDFLVGHHLAQVEFDSGPPLASQLTVSFCELTGLLRDSPLVDQAERARLAPFWPRLGC